MNSLHATPPENTNCLGKRLVPNPNAPIRSQYCMARCVRCNKCLVTTFKNDAQKSEKKLKIYSQFKY